MMSFLVFAFLVTNLIFNVVTAQSSDSLLHRSVRQLLTDSIPDELKIPLVTLKPHYSGDDEDGDGCSRDEAAWDDDGLCHPLLTQGPCEITELFVLDPDSLQPYCAPRLCQVDRVFIAEDESCHDPHEEKMCPPGRQLFMSAFGTAVCGCPLGYYELDDDEDRDVCVPLLSTLPCQFNKVFWFRDSKDPPECVDDPCGGLNVLREPDSAPFVPSGIDGLCHRIGEQLGVCFNLTYYAMDMELLIGFCATLEESGFLVLNTPTVTALTTIFGPLIFGLNASAAVPATINGTTISAFGAIGTPGSGSISSASGTASVGPGTIGTSSVSISISSTGSSSSSSSSSTGFLTQPLIRVSSSPSPSPTDTKNNEVANSGDLFDISTFLARPDVHVGSRSTTPINATITAFATTTSHGRLLPVISENNIGKSLLEGSNTTVKNLSSAPNAITEGSPPFSQSLINDTQESEQKVLSKTFFQSESHIVPEESVPHFTLQMAKLLNSIPIQASTKSIRDILSTSIENFSSKSTEISSSSSSSSDTIEDNDVIFPPLLPPTLFGYKFSSEEDFTASEDNMDYGRYRRSPRPVPGAIVNRGLMGCKAGSRRGYNFKCHSTVSIPRGVGMRRRGRR